MKLPPAQTISHPTSINPQSTTTIFQINNTSNVAGTPNSKLTSINSIASPRSSINMTLRGATQTTPAINANTIHQSNSNTIIVNLNSANSGLISSTTSNNSININGEQAETTTVTTTGEINNENISNDSDSSSASSSEMNTENESNAESTSSKNSRMSKGSKLSRGQSLRAASTSFNGGNINKHKKSKNKLRRLTASMVNQSIMSNLISYKAIAPKTSTNPTSITNSSSSPNSKTSTNKTSESVNIGETILKPTTKNINKLIPANEIKIESDSFVASIKPSENSMIINKEHSINNVLKLASTVTQYQANKKTNENNENGVNLTILNKSTVQPQEAENNSQIQSERLKRKSIVKIIDNKNQSFNPSGTNPSPANPKLVIQNKITSINNNNANNKQKSKSDDESTENSNKNGHYMIRSRTKTVNETQLLSGENRKTSIDKNSISPVNGRAIRKLPNKRSIDQNQTLRLSEKSSTITAHNLNRTMPNIARRGLNVSNDERMMIENESVNDSTSNQDTSSVVSKTTTLTNNSKETLKKQRSSIQLHKLNENQKETPTQSSHASVDDIKLSLFRTALKLTYLNTCSRLSDADYDFLFQSMPVYNTYSSLNNNNNSSSSSGMLTNSTQNSSNCMNTGSQIRSTSKSYLNKLIIDNIDGQTSNKVSQSPLYSLILQVDADFLTIQVFIQYLDHTSLAKMKTNKSIASNDIDDHDYTNLIQKRFIKLINLKPLIQTNESGQLVRDANFIGNDKSKFSRQLSGLSSETKWSKYLFEQLKNNVINLFHLNKQNLMCLSIETRILERLCFATFQLYLNDFLHTCILIIPNYLANSFVFDALANWKYETFSVNSYFKSMISLIKYLKRINLTDFSSNNVSLNDIETFFNNKTIKDYLNLNNLPQLVEIIEFVYTNYAKIVSNLEQTINNKDLDEGIKKEFDLKSMQATFDSIDYFYMTCLLCDLFRFLHDYRVNPKRFSSLNELKMPWNYNGSLLNNLLCVQLIENSTPISRRSTNSTASIAASKEKQQTQMLKNTNESFNTPNRVGINSNKSIKKSIEAITAQIVASQNESNNQKSLLECDNSRLEYLNSMKKSLEKLVLDLIDFSSDSINRERYSYPTTSSSNIDDMNESSDMGFSMIEMYSSLCQMFDVNFKNVKYNSSSSKYQIQQSLTNRQLQSILDYYDFRNLVNLENINFEYKTFFESFFGDLPTDLKIDFNLELSACLKEQNTLGKSIFLPNTKIIRKFVEFVYHSNSIKFCPLISFLATIYLCLPSIIDFREVSKLENSQSSKISPLTTQELVGLENKLKFLSTVDYNGVNKLDEGLIKFDEIPYLE